MNLPAKSILIIGGGFTGMCTAIQLAKHGAEIDLVEIDENWRTEGAGLTVSGPSLRALSQVGVLDEFLERGAMNPGLNMHTPDGKLFAAIPALPLPGTQITGGGGIMRSDLAKILADKTKQSGVNIRLGLTYTNIDQHDSSVDVSFTDGSEKTYDLVLGTDGLYSSVRKTIFPDAPEPAYTGQGVWRAVLPRLGMQTATMYLGKDDKVGFTPVSNELMYLYFNDARPQKEFINEEDLLPTLRALLEPYPAELVKKVRDTLSENSQINYRPLEGLILPRPWNSGRVILLGDAVHATTPHLASGAGMGFEDGVVFADEFAKGGDIFEVMTRYQNRRWERCRMVVENSLRLGEIELASGPKEEHAQVMALSQAALFARI